MAAQIGSSVLLQYGVQGAQQPGSSVLLNYDVQTEGTVSRRVASGTTAPWVKASKAVNDLFSPSPATDKKITVADAPWEKAVASNVIDMAPWVKPLRSDTERRSPTGAFCDMLLDNSDSRWNKSAPQDNLDGSAWGAYGDIVNGDMIEHWVGSKAVDAMDTGAWPSYMILAKVRVPYTRPDGLLANFSVIGGGIAAMFGGAGYVPPIGNMLDFQFGASDYVAPFMRIGDDFQIPRGTQANFVRKETFAYGTDAVGEPIYESGFRDAFRIGVWGVPKRQDKEAAHPWTKFSFPLYPGWGIVVPGGTVIVPGESVIIPIQRAYIVVNDFQLIRVDGTVPIVASTLSISFDCDSWLPQFSATIPESARGAVMPDPNPVEVEAHINGTSFRFFVEKVVRNRQFAQRTVTISGRGIACELDAPYAVSSQHTNGAGMTVQQLISDALTNTGYTQTWGITDWLVPANTFSLFGTPAQVAGEVANAAGAVLSADWELRDLIMRPRYPVKPWDWATATPDFVIPGAVTQTESLEWTEKPAYNVVYVSGVQNGVLGQVKITGTAGDLPAPMVTHPLITHDDAVRQKGISILGDTGRKSMLQISLPILPATGVIDLCKLIEFNDGNTTRRGIVRANSINVNWPTVRQTLTVEAAA